jgi:hypothetical protein
LRMAFKAIRNPRMTIRRMATIRRIDYVFIGDQFRGILLGSDVLFVGVETVWFG